MYAFIKKPQSRNDKSSGQKYMAAEREERLPAQLKARMEQRTGLPFDDVRIHYNSDRPDTVQNLCVILVREAETWNIWHYQGIVYVT